MTLTIHWFPTEQPADERAEALFTRLKNIGFQCCLLSNNQYERVSSFNRNIQVHFIENAHKPSTEKLSEGHGVDGNHTGEHGVCGRPAFY